MHLLCSTCNIGLPLGSWNCHFSFRVFKVCKFWCSVSVCACFGLLKDGGGKLIPGITKIPWSTLIFWIIFSTLLDVLKITLGEIKLTKTASYTNYPREQNLSHVYTATKNTCRFMAIKLQADRNQCHWCARDPHPSFLWPACFLLAIKSWSVMIASSHCKQPCNYQQHFT